jgi:protein arginine N-methyltransferase 1
MKNELGQYIPLHYHYQMLSDKNRMNAFEKAIAAVVLKSHKVVDLGSGTGVMTFNAAKKGGQVWGIENNPALATHSQYLMKRNGIRDQVNIIHADAMEWEPEEAVDVVICEMLHSALLREKQVEVISKFRNKHFDRFNKIPVFLPTATLLAVQPVWHKYTFAGYHAPIPLFEDAYSVTAGLTPLCDPIIYKTVDYFDAEVEPIEGNLIFKFKNDAQVNALRFITKSILSMDLVSGETTDWHNQHLTLQLDDEIQVKSGQEIQVTFCYTPGDPIEKLHQSMNVKVVSDCNEPKKRPNGYVRIIEIKPKRVRHQNSSVEHP